MSVYGEPTISLSHLLHYIAGECTILEKIQFLELLPVAANPGSTSSIWVDSASGHLMRGAVDVESLAAAGGIPSIGTSTADAITRWSGTTGAALEDGTVLLKYAGTSNYFIGPSVSTAAITTAANNFGIGTQALAALTSGSRNAALGYQTGKVATQASDSSLVGYLTGSSLTTGVRNTLLGSLAGYRITTGAGNLCLGYNSGSNYVSSEHDNILLSNTGTLGENGVIRIGTSGTHNSTYLQGLTGNWDVGATNVVTVDTTTGFLQIIPTGATTIMGSIDFTGTYASNLVLNTAVEFSPVTTLTTNSNFDSPAGGRLRYLGSVARTVQASFSGSIASASPIDLKFELFVNGVAVTNGAVRSSATTAYSNIHFTRVVNLSPNDYVNVRCTNLTDSTDITVYDYHLSILTCWGA